MAGVAGLISLTALRSCDSALLPVVQPSGRVESILPVVVRVLHSVGFMLLTVAQTFPLEGLLLQPVSQEFVESP